MKNKSLLVLIVLSLSSFLASCGKNGGGSSSPQEQQENTTPAARAAIDGSNIQGSYLAPFTTINPQVVGTIPGAAHIKREDSLINVFVRVFAGSPSIAHFQNVHMGNRCPTMSDDTNGDGFIDYQEAIAVVGPVIIPLDWDISSQAAGGRSWPKAFENGSYDYLKIASFNRFWNDLKDEDSNKTDNIAKLAPEEGLDIAGKVVLIQGVGEHKTLPETVAGNGRYRNIQTLPIACGVFNPTTEEPGVEYQEGIPGPIAPVNEGQDMPAPEGADEIAGTGTVIQGPSNDAGSNDSNSGGNTETPTTTPDTDDDNEDENEEGGWRWPWEW
jgi:hypothetical protein